MDNEPDRNIKNEVNEKINEVNKLTHFSIEQHRLMMAVRLLLETIVDLKGTI